jgi:hypothetical protein
MLRCLSGQARRRPGNARAIKTHRKSPRSVRVIEKVKFYIYVALLERSPEATLPSKPSWSHTFAYASCRSRIVSHTNNAKRILTRLNGSRRLKTPKADHSLSLHTSRLRRKFSSGNENQRDDHLRAHSRRQETLPPPARDIFNAPSRSRAENRPW